MSRGEANFLGVLLNPFVKILAVDFGQGGNVASLSVGQDAAGMPVAALHCDIEHVRRSGCGGRHAQLQDSGQEPVSSSLSRAAILDAGNGLYHDILCLLLLAVIALSIS